jgi:CRP/FNR family transcriptional regulator, anaerobic regulatory protein
MLEKLFLVRCFTLLEDRIFSQLSLTAEERYQDFFGKNQALFNQVPLQYIASMLGMTAQTLSRIRKKATTVNS